MDPAFLTRTEILAIHADQLRRYGGADGIRDEGLLDSALAAPQSAFGGKFLHSGLHEMAAAYLFHLVSNHPFLDGNKRVGAVAAAVFFRLNDFELIAAENDYEKLVLGVAKGITKKPEITKFFRARARGAARPR